MWFRQHHPSQARGSCFSPALQLDFSTARGWHHVWTRGWELKVGEAVCSPSVRHPDSSAGAGGEATRGWAADGVLQEEGVTLGKVSFWCSFSRLKKEKVLYVAYFVHSCFDFAMAGWWLNTTFAVTQLHCERSCWNISLKARVRARLW